jgi:hypothetical protein
MTQLEKSKKNLVFITHKLLMRMHTQHHTHKWLMKQNVQANSTPAGSK